MSSPNLNPTVPKSAPYGHACVGCSKAKSRCISRGPGNSCQRCHRMSKECHPSAVASKRLTRRPASKTVRLEEKLDDLVTLLKTQAATKLLEQRHDLGGARSDQQHNGFSSGLPTRSIGDSLHRQPNEAIPAIPDIRAEPGRLCEMSSVRTTPHSADSLHSLPLPPSQADEYLRTFQAHHLKALPFIHIPPELTYVSPCAMSSGSGSSASTNCSLIKALPDCSANAHFSGSTSEHSAASLRWRATSSTRLFARP